MELIVIDTKSFTKHWSFKIVRETGLHPNLLSYWHNTLVGISPRTTQPITINRDLCHRSERPFFFSRLNCDDDEVRGVGLRTLDTVDTTVHQVTTGCL